MIKKITINIAPETTNHHQEQVVNPYSSQEPVFHPDTILCVNLKTLLRNDRKMRPGKCYTGTLRKDAVVEEYRCDDHYTFVEDVPRAYSRNPRVFEGKYVTITRHRDGSYRANLKLVEIGDGFDIIGYASAVSNELLWGLESLVEK